MNKMKLLLTGLLIMSCLPLSNSLQAADTIKEGSHINAIMRLSYCAIAVVTSGIMINLAIKDIANFGIKKNYFNKLYILELLQEKTKRFYPEYTTPVKKYFTERYVSRNVDNNNYDFLNIFDSQTKTKLVNLSTIYKKTLDAHEGVNYQNSSQEYIDNLFIIEKEARKNLLKAIKEVKESLNTPKWLRYIPSAINSLMLGAFTIGAYQMVKTGYAQTLYYAYYRNK